MKICKRCVLTYNFKMIYNLETAVNHCSPHQPQIFCNHGSWSWTHYLGKKLDLVT